MAGFNKVLSMFGVRNVWSYFIFHNVICRTFYFSTSEFIGHFLFCFVFR